MTRAVRRTSIFSVALALCSVFAEGGCGREAFQDVFPRRTFWLDDKENGIYIERKGDRLVAVRTEPWTCDHPDGAGTTSEGPLLDFKGTLRPAESGESGTDPEVPMLALTGIIKACRYGRDPGEQACPPCPNGIFDGIVNGTVNRALDEITGTIEDPQTADTSSVTYTRVDCRPRPPGHYLPDEHLAWERHYFEDRTLVEYVGRDPTGRQTHTSVRAGVRGSVQEVFADDTPPYVISVVADDGNRIDYDFKIPGAEPLVESGEQVDHSSKLGLLPRTEVFRLQLRGFEEGTNAPMNPDCIGHPRPERGIKVPKELWGQ